MADDSFLGLVNLLGREEATTGAMLGRVTCAVPLRVLVGGNTMEAGELLCNAGLLTGDTPRWRVGEQLLLWPIEDQQRYIILCKVVGL